jgi:hypothetical protein
MGMRAVAAVAAIAVFLATSPGHAFDAAQAEIIGLRLGMADIDVTAALRRQGFAVTTDHGALVARTLDGQVTVYLTGTQTVRRISYTLKGYGAGETEKIEGSVLDRFGPPDQAKPMAWCRKLGRDGMCPDAVPSLTYQRDTKTLDLRAGTQPGE